MSDNEIRELNAGHWYWIDKAVIQEYVSKVGATGIAVYNFLASMVNRQQRCFPSQKYIAEHLGYSRTTVNKILKRLAIHGLVKIVKKRGCTCEYLLLRCKAEETRVSSGVNRDVKQRHTNNL